ncbi:response regulator transcription factor [Nocardioides okcheonensis]|uniref:response regulator transcription factor n=1 Tax=Nocardioides okcheonensis TaxID=2894081 RepID=UPI001E440CAF|nr:response regulator transcription factor [Nocardioides okcheonensis]UFN42860.1 response regulator transcription factor [Nocardioides okcheonensis]
MQDLHALVVEDDPDISSALVETLEGAGFRVSSAPDGRAAVDIAAADPPDLVTLDLTLPHMDGIEVCRRIREASDCYIVIVSARSDEVDKLIGLEVGADDFVLKPFSPRELRARVAALFRRPRTASAVEEAQAQAPRVPAPSQPADEATTIACGAGLVINSARREVQVDGTIVELTRIEYDVLEYLATHLSRVCTREEMVLAIWSSALTHDHHLVDVHVANLRGKLRRHSDATWIHTIRGIGYRMDREGEGRRTGGGPYLVARFDSEDWARGLDF